MPLYGVFCHGCGKLMGEIETGDKPHLEHTNEHGKVTIDVSGMKSFCEECSKDVSESEE